MKQFKSSLHAFIEGKADLDDLVKAINRLAIESDSSVQDALENCEILTEKGLLSAKVCSRLKQEVEYLESHAPSSNVLNDDNKTIVVDAPTTLGSNTVTASSDQSETIPSYKLGQDFKSTIGIGSKLKDRFILVEELGRGGMGIVYKARDFRKEETHDREPFVAIKMLGRELQEKKFSIIALQRETKKAQILAHPNIITVYDFDRDGENVYMTMEYLEGEPLNSLIKKQAQKPVEIKRAISIIEQMGRALAYAHKRGIVHSDFKPGNVFVTKSDEVKVLDFGIARATILPEHQKSSEDSIFDAGDFHALTPVYASKEMLERKNPDPRDDVYGLAIVSCQLLTGHHPYHRLPANDAHKAGLKPQYIDKLPRSIKNTLEHALEFERDKRTTNAGQFLQELNIRPRRKKSLKRRLVEITAIILFILLSLYSANLFITVKQSEIILQETASISDPEIRQKVEHLLTIAEAHILVKRLMDPPGSSAYYAYQQVLKSHKENKQAHEGLRNIADHYEKMATKNFKNGEIEKARDKVKKGLTAFTSHQGLNNLKNKID